MNRSPEELKAISLETLAESRAKLDAFSLKTLIADPDVIPFFIQFIHTHHTLQDIHDELFNPEKRI